MLKFLINNNKIKYQLLLLLFIYQHSFSQLPKFEVKFENQPCIKCNYELYDRDSVIVSGRTDIEGNLFIDNSVIKRVKSIKIYISDKTCFFTDFIDTNSKILDCKNNIVENMSTKEIEELTIYASKKVFEDEGDKIVYNVSKEKKNINESSSEILRRTPFVSIDINGTPSIKGNSNVLILLNGKEISGIQSSQIIKQIPSNEILKIEVITSPSSKYSAEGISGILNIITKKNILVKNSGNIGLGLGTSGSHFYTNHNYLLNNKYTLSNSIGALLYYPSVKSNQKINSSQLILERETVGENIGQMYYYSSTLSSNNNDSKYFDFSFDYYYSNTKNNSNHQFSSNTKQESEFTNRYQYFKIKSDYKITFPKKNILNNSISISYLPISNNFSYNSISYNNSVNIIDTSVQTDYNFNIKKNFSFNIGAKSTLNIYAGERELIYNTSNFSQQRFDATQYLLSSFIDSKYKLNNKTNISLGVRYEFLNFVSSNIVNKLFHNFFYNIGYNYKINSKTSFSANFNRRIHRPSYYNLFPFENNLSNNVLKVGNPALIPGISYNMELGFSKYFENIFIKISPFYKLINNKISNFVYFYNNSFISTPINLDREINTGISIWSTLNLFKQKVLINYGVDYIYKELYFSGQKNTGVQILNSLNLTYNINENWRVNLFGSFNTPNIYIQGIENSYTHSNISLQKDFLKNNLIIALSVDNPFSKGFTHRQNYNINNINFYNEQLFFNRGIRIFAIYKFGSKDSSKNIKNKNVENILNNENN